MLIPVVPAADEAADLEYVKRARAAGGAVLVSAPSQTLRFSGYKVYFDDVDDVAKVGEILNAGASYVVASEATVDSVLEAYPAERVILRVDAVEKVQTLSAKCKQIQVALPLEAAETSIEELGNALKNDKTLVISVFIKEVSPDEATITKAEVLVGRLHKLVKDRPIDVAIPVNASSLVEQPPANQISPGRCFLNCLAPSDRPDGLFATVVCDERNMALGLVYSSKESILVSIGSGRGVYWSRSRGKLWRKGEESGAIQELLSISTDCDQDCLRFNVIQRGNPPAFCHRNTRTCWGADGGVSHLFRTLQERKVSAPVGSYTARLYGDMTLLRDKLLEEAAELAEAVKGVSDGKDRPHHVEEETADVIYFALTACVAGNGSLLEVERQLDKRSLTVKRRKGDSKQARKEETEGRLKELAEAKRLKETSN